MPYSKIVTEEFLERIERSVAEQHVLVEEVRKVSRTNRALKWVAGVLAVVIAAVSFLAVNNYNTAQTAQDNSAALKEQIKATQQFNETFILETCRGRNSSQRDLRASQLEASVGTIDALLAALNAQSGPSPERTHTADEIKRLLRERAAEKEAHPEVPDQDCDGDGMPGGTDADDYAPTTVPGG